MQAKDAVGLTVGTHVLGVVRNLDHVARPVFQHALALDAVHVIVFFVGGHSETEDFQPSLGG
jgi:hypothetical protein